MTTDIQSAEDIRARLNEIAPWKPGNMGAGELARWFGMEAQVVWARMLDPGHSIDPRDIGTLHGFFAAASLLLQLRQYAPARADEMARYLSDEFEDPDGLGEKLWQYHGGHAPEVADLARRLAELTVVDGAGHVHAREPAQS